MFDFQKLEVYKKAKNFNNEIRILLQTEELDRNTTDQLRRASFSIMLNIAEGSSRFGNRDRKNFLVISRGSVFECASILEFLSEMNQLDTEIYNRLYTILEELSKMLFALIKKLDN